MKIMVWNIEQFTQAKLMDLDMYGPPGHTTRKRKRIQKNGYDRRWYMKEVFNAWHTPATAPDVIAIVEVKAEKALNRGDILGATYRGGVLNLLNYIKHWTHNANWRIVPPRKCNLQYNAALVNKAQEAVAVFYNSATVIFEGPDYWGGGGGVAYPAPWNSPAISGGTVRAGRVVHVNAGGAPVDFPTNRYRNPFMVDFRETGVGGRLFRLLFVHTSPQHGLGGSHVTGTDAIADIRDMNPATNTTAAPDFYVACGDFNVNEYNATGEPAAAYGRLTGINFVKQFTTPPVDSTHFWRKGNTVHELSQPAPDPFGYMHHEIIDNFFVCQAAFGPAPAYVSEVINCVNGSPAPWGTAMIQTLAVINALPTGYGLSGPIAAFREWQNFWCIIATSDHTPIYLRIP